MARVNAAMVLLFNSRIVSGSAFTEDESAARSLVAGAMGALLGLPASRFVWVKSEQSGDWLNGVWRVSFRVFFRITS